MLAWLIKWGQVHNTVSLIRWKIIPLNTNLLMVILHRVFLGIGLKRANYLKKWSVSLRFYWPFIVSAQIWNKLHAILVQSSSNVQQWTSAFPMPNKLYRLRCSSRVFCRFSKHGVILGWIFLDIQSLEDCGTVWTHTCSSCANDQNPCFYTGAHTYW